MDYKKLKSYAYENIASLFWSSFLLIGGGVFVLYYAGIGYMPDFDFKSSITLISAVSITGILILLLMLTIFILPGAFWASAWPNSSLLKERWGDDNHKGNGKLITITKWFAIPLLYLYALYFSALYFKSISILITGFSLGIIICILVVYYVSKLKGWVLASEVFGVIFYSFISSVMAFFPFYFIYTLISSTSQNDPVIIGVVAAVFIMFINVIAAAKPSKVNVIYYNLVLGLVSVFVVFSLFGIGNNIPKRVMEIYKFGNIDAEKVVFKDSGCETLEIHGLIKNYTKKEQCSLSKVKILSRLGKDMFIEVNNISLTIKNSEILSWSIKTIPKNKLKTKKDSSKNL